MENQQAPKRRQEEKVKISIQVLEACYRRVVTKRKIFGDLIDIATDPKLDPLLYQCDNCWQRGHRVSGRSKPRTQRICENCGRRDIHMHDCLRCLVAYKRYARNNGRPRVSRKCENQPSPPVYVPVVPHHLEIRIQLVKWLSPQENPDVQVEKPKNQRC